MAKQDKNQEAMETEEGPKKAEEEALEESEEGKHQEEASKQEAGESPEENVERAQAVEEGAQAKEEPLAEAEAVNVDTETAKEAEEKVVKGTTEAESKVAALQGSAQAPKEEKKPARPEQQRGAPTGKFKDLIKKIESLSVVELAELVKVLEERFGVSAAAPVAPQPSSGQAPVTGAGTSVSEEKARVTLVLANAGAQKIAVIKALREIKPDLGLKDAKDLVDGAPKEVAADLPIKEAEEAKKKLEAAGAQVELK